LQTLSSFLLSSRAGRRTSAAVICVCVPFVAFLFACCYLGSA
jgi:hypothetical protein